MKSMCQAGLLLIILTLISGILYPTIVTGIGQLIWHGNSNGSLIKKDDIVIGSSLIAQSFKKPEYFWPRPSASSFSAMPSGASNLGPTSRDLAKQIDGRQTDLSATNSVAKTAIPIDLLTASASGLDPHISVEAARVQVKRIAKARGLNNNGEALINQLIDDRLENRQFHILGEPRVNVLLLNIELDHCCQGNIK